MLRWTEIRGILQETMNVFSEGNITIVVELHVVFCAISGAEVNAAEQMENGQDKGGASDSTAGRELVTARPTNIFVYAYNYS